MANNVKLEYAYRDAGNYKLFGSVVFPNNASFSPEQAQQQIRACLIEGDFFIPEIWGVPRLSFEAYVPELDHQWHVFENIEITNEQPTDLRTFQEFLREIMSFPNPDTLP